MNQRFYLPFVDAALILLIHFQWNKEVLQENYFNDSDKVISSTGLIFQTPLPLQLPYTCIICDNEYHALSDVSLLNCNHKACKNCYQQYLYHQVHDGIGCIKTKCLEYKCNAPIPFTLFKNLLNEKDFSKYSRFVTDDFIKNCKRLKWCTSPKCDLVILTSSPQVKSVFCSCGQCSCFQCGEEGHEPASCHQTKIWLEKCSEDFPSKKWILLNTKNCPSCKEATEKNQGCNHMTCRVCKHEYCWICLGVWSEHNDNYKCNKPVTVNPNAAKDKIELEQCVHFFERYHGHGKGMEYAKEQMERMKVRVDQLDNSSQREHSYLLQAIKVLETVVECRRVLKYTYVMGAFLDANDPKKGLFEYQQEMLEKNTEL